jgi:hypothetical protein
MMLRPSASNRSRERGAPEALEYGLSSFRLGELRVTPELTFDGDPPDVFAHLRGDPHPFRWSQAPKDGELHRASLVTGVAAEHNA